MASAKCTSQLKQHRLRGAFLCTILCLQGSPQPLILQHLDPTCSAVEIWCVMQSAGAHGSHSFVSAFLMRMDEYQRRLHLHRLEQRRSQEDALLQRFG